MNPHELIAKVAEHLRSMWRFRWAALALTWLVGIGGMIFVFSMPDVYRASTQVFVDTNNMLRPLLRGLTAPSNPLEAVQLVNRTVRTRPNLESIAYATDLLLGSETENERERVVSELQANINIGASRDNAYIITFTHPNREKSVEVVKAVYNTMVEAAIGQQDDDQDETEQGLASELNYLVEEIDRADAALAQFKRDNIGYLPGDSGDYASRLQSAVAQVGETEALIEVETRKRDELRRQLEGEVPTFGMMGTIGIGGRNCSESSRISGLESQRDELSLRFTERHPDIQEIDELLERLEERCAQESADSPNSFSEGSSSAQPLTENMVYQNVRMQLTDVEVNLQVLDARLQAQRAAVEKLRRDVDKITEVETAAAKLTRDGDILRSRYQALRSRQEDFRSSQRLDPKFAQVEYRVIEPAFAPDEPAGPPRRTYIGMASFAAIGAGAGVAFLLSMLMPAFFNRRSLEKLAGVPVLGVVSMIVSEGQEARRRKDLSYWVAAFLSFVLVVLVAIAVAAPASRFVQSLL